MRVLSILFYILSLVPLQAQNTPCQQPVNTFIFNQYRSQMQSQNSDYQRLNIGKNFLQSYCLTTSQVKELCGLFGEDYVRLEFAKLAYVRTIDRSNYYEVFNSFMYFSTVFTLYDHIKAVQNSQTIQQPNVLTFPEYSYPSAESSSNNRNCQYPMAENDFYLQAQQVAALNNDTDRSNRLSQIAANNCLTVAQIMKFSSLLSQENNRLVFLKRAYDRCYDIDHYPATVQVFNHMPNRSNLMNYVAQQNQTTTTPPSEAPCQLSEAEYKQVHDMIKDESFDNARLNTAKTLLQQKKCFTTEQITGLAKLFPFSSSKMKFLREAYQYTTDKENFYNIAQVLRFNSEKEELRKIIKDGGN